MKTRIFFAGTVVLGAVWSCRAQIAPPEQPKLVPAVAPKTDTIWTSTREIRALQLRMGGGVWAATAGGVLGFDGKKWTKWTRRDGLPSHETLGIAERLHQPVARFPKALATFSGRKWTAQSAAVSSTKPREFVWNRRKIRVLLDGLELDGKLQPIPSSSMGTHISAVLNVGKTLLVAIYGDGLWNFDGHNWKRAAQVPVKAREVTALANDGVRLWIGTRREGLWEGREGKWKQHLQRDEPLAHNAQAFADFGGVLWMSTLDDGLVARTGAGWTHVAPPTLSSSAPRQLFRWGNRLFVRHGGGAIDSFNGRVWRRDLLGIPRVGVYALGGDEKRLLASGWGGWSEWDGAKWTAHYDIPALKGVPVFDIVADGNHVWLATQSRGVGRWNRVTKAFEFLDERAGLPDDWVTKLALINGKIYAGTFVGGLARLDGEKWHVFSSTKGLNVTAIEAGANGEVWAATRHGLWRVKGDEATKVNVGWLDSEMQALRAGKGGLWIGTRTSLNFLSDK